MPSTAVFNVLGRAANDRLANRPHPYRCKRLRFEPQCYPSFRLILGLLIPVDSAE